MKKNYIKPQTTALDVMLEQNLLSASGDGLTINAYGDYVEGTNVDLAKGNDGGVWGFDDED